MVPRVPKYANIVFNPSPSLTDRTSATPRFSVIVPAYNQAAYLGEAVSSALTQTFGDLEVVVVDDGSTDGTDTVIDELSADSRVVTVRQANAGPGAARNAGIARSNGAYLAFLDADDAWLSGYLAAVARAIDSHSDADAFYSPARVMDMAGRDMPQLASVQALRSTKLYQALLRANFLVPSAVVVKAASVTQLGLFDTSPQLSGVEDRDLWYRMLQHRMTFVAMPGVHVRYRSHAENMSANFVRMQHGALALAEKHFGPDDGHEATWSADKRRAYGGYYLFVTLSSVMAGDDQLTIATSLRRALEVDPSLADDAELFYELALGRQPVGKRGTSHALSLEASSRALNELLALVFTLPLSGTLEAVKQRAYATAYFELAKVARLLGEASSSRAYALRALATRKRLAASLRWWRLLVSSVVSRQARRRRIMADGNGVAR